MLKKTPAESDQFSMCDKGAGESELPAKTSQEHPDMEPRPRSPTLAEMANEWLMRDFQPLHCVEPSAPLDSEVEQPERTVQAKLWFEMYAVLFPRQ